MIRPRKAQLGLLQCPSDRCYFCRTKIQIDEHTNFRLASVTKQFSAMCIMLLVREGKLHYEDRLTSFLPEFPPYGNAIKVRNLLNHTSGLED